MLRAVGNSQLVVEVPGSYSALVTAGDHQQHLVAACGQKCILSPLSTLTDVNSSHSGSSSSSSPSRSRVEEGISRVAGPGLIWSASLPPYIRLMVTLVPSCSL